jgi:3D (Asp-Asp-Asp) domain-containing protein
VAADPRVLPIGTRILVHEAGPYSGEYIVADTGAAIRGYEIDLWMESREEALRFGRRAVLVEVLRYGEP